MSRNQLVSPKEMHSKTARILLMPILTSGLTFFVPLTLANVRFSISAITLLNRVQEDKTVTTHLSRYLACLLVCLYSINNKENLLVAKWTVLHANYSYQANQPI